MAFTLWLTGLPCAGKTTIAKELLKIIDAQHLDGDIIRKSLTKDLGYSPQDRFENLRRVSIVAKMLNDSGTNVIASFVSPLEAMREMVRLNVKPHTFALIHIHCPLAECILRDDKGMYKKAIRGDPRYKQFTGIGAPYEEPKRPDIKVDTSKLTLDQCVNIILSFLEKKELIKPRSTLFIGRFSPPHKGHKYLFDSVLNNGGEIVIAIRDTPVTKEDPLTAEQRMELLMKLYKGHPRVSIIIIPDVSEVCVGRKVGYKIMAVPEKIRIVSGTKVRKGKYDDIPEEIRDLVKEMLRDGKEKNA